jgi:DNA-binding response OmpR family regulator
MRLLLINHDPLQGTFLQKRLKQAGYAVDWAQKGGDVVSSLAMHDYDVVVLEHALPDVPVDALIDAIRRVAPGTGVLVLTASHSVRQCVKLLDHGADDFMIKPVNPNEMSDELEARLRAVLRRASAKSANVLEIHGPLKLIPAQRKAVWHEKPVELTNKEYRLLEVLVRRNDQVVTRAQLEENLYAWGDEVGSNAVEVYVHSLRKKLSPDLIRNERGVGYRLSLDAPDPSRGGRSSTGAPPSTEKP